MDTRRKRHSGPFYVGHDKCSSAPSSGLTCLSETFRISTQRNATQNLCLKKSVVKIELFLFLTFKYCSLFSLPLDCRLEKQCNVEPQCFKNVSMLINDVFHVSLMMALQQEIKHAKTSGEVDKLFDSRTTARPSTDKTAPAAHFTCNWFEHDFDFILGQKLSIRHFKLYYFPVFYT